MYDEHYREVPGMREQMAAIKAEIKETLALVREATRLFSPDNPLAEAELRAARARLRQRGIEV